MYKTEKIKLEEPKYMHVYEYTRSVFAEADKKYSTVRIIGCSLFNFPITAMQYVKQYDNNTSVLADAKEIHVR